MGGTTSSVQPGANSELPKGKVDPKLVGVWTNCDGTSQSRLELNIDGTYCFVIRGFDEKLIKTTKQKGEWGRFSKYIVLKCKSMYYGFGCGTGPAGWMEFVGSTQFEIITESQIVFYEGEKAQSFQKGENRQNRYISEFGTTTEDGLCTTVFIQADGKFKLIETPKSNIPTHFHGEWFPYFVPSRGILLHASHSRLENLNKKSPLDKGKGIRVEFDSDSDEESVQEIEEKEVNQIWGIWVDQVNPSQLRLVKDPPAQLFQTQVLQEEQEKKEFYLPGKGKLAKPPLVQPGNVLYSLHEKNFQKPSPASVKAEPKPIVSVSPQPSAPQVVPKPSPNPTHFITPVVPKPTLPKPNPPKQESDYSLQLKTLEEMGFNDTELNRTILDYTGGNLNDTVDQIMASLEMN